MTLGVEFGGGYDLHYQCIRKAGGPPVTEASVSAQAQSMYKVSWRRQQWSGVARCCGLPEKTPQGAQREGMLWCYVLPPGNDTH